MVMAPDTTCLFIVDIDFKVAVYILTRNASDLNKKMKYYIHVFQTELNLSRHSEKFWSSELGVIDRIHFDLLAEGAIMPREIAMVADYNYLANDRARVDKNPS
jgi:hypothetical protein